MSNLSGTGTSKNRLIFNGDEGYYELWETKFLAHLHLRDLGDVLDVDSPDAAKNKKVFAELVLLLDDVSLSLVMRDAKDDGKSAVTILREHYLGKSKPRIISLYSELAALKMKGDESVTDYILRAEANATALKNAGETISDSLLIAMCLRGLPSYFDSFATVINQKDETIDFIKFKCSLRGFEESQKSRSLHNEVADNVMHYRNNNVKCYNCNQQSHIKHNCSQKPK